MCRGRNGIDIDEIGIEFKRLFALFLGKEIRNCCCISSVVGSHDASR